ncbi:Ig-like domain-containing protein, partial [Enterobacteriaceae bacterium H11S18]|uniref:Ig-like domain-containing protein n=1 Tax=Dryocola clanedunensis TaxID=2925396 RepID=UPI0022F0AC6C
PSDSIDFVVDTVGQMVSINSVVDDVDPVTGDVANNGYTNDATPTLNGEATANAIVNIYDGKALIGSTTASADGKWSFTPAQALADGEHDFTATVVTAAAGESAPTDVWVVNIDTVV